LEEGATTKFAVVTTPGLGALQITVSSRPDLDAQGRLAAEFSRGTVNLTERTSLQGRYEGFSGGGLWENLPGEYYWQPNGYEPGTAVPLIGPVYTLQVVSSSTADDDERCPALDRLAARKREERAARSRYKRRPTRENRAKWKRAQKRLKVARKRAAELCPD
jgi:hypothetical protein